jgi:hypothetical protein
MSDDLHLPTVLGDLRGGIDQAAACLDTVASGVDAVLAGLPGTAPAATRVLRRRFDAGVGWVQRATATGGDPGVLRAAGSVWAVDIGNREVADVLTALADAITTFWVDVSVACATLAAALFAAAVAAAGPLGAADALGSALAAVATFGAVAGSARVALGAAAREAAARLGAVGLPRV